MDANSLAPIAATRRRSVEPLTAPEGLAGAPFADQDAHVAVGEPALNSGGRRLRPHCRWVRP